MSRGTRTESARRRGGLGDRTELRRVHEPVRGRGSPYWTGWRLATW